MRFSKIINDPVYGFITVDDEFINAIISHPFFQRLRRINQMALASLVYPGAVHTRMHHALGAYHLMCQAMSELMRKGANITPQEQQAAKLAILLHDVGHGPFSHALEQILAEGMHHEEIGKLILNDLNKQYDGKLQMAIEIFNNTYPKKFLHQLISGQLDVDRMDYLTRDSFFTGVHEGIIAYDRIIKMLVVNEGELMVEEKGIHSIEKFLVSRRLMYWQVYLHKTVLVSEQMLKRIISRARMVNATCPGPLNAFINNIQEQLTLQNFCLMDDVDVMMAVKTWVNHSDKILSVLCKGILERKLLKVKFSSEPVPEQEVQTRQEEVIAKTGLTPEEAEWLVFTGEASSSTYNFEDENIRIVFKDGTVKDISEVNDALISQNMKVDIKKYYFCYLRV